MDLGTHPLRDLPRPERVVQLCHPKLGNEFPPLRVSAAVISPHLPVQLTSFVGREAELTQVRKLLAENRLVTLTGAGLLGKTRRAVQVTAPMVGEFGDAEDRQCYLVVGGDPASPTCCTRGRCGGRGADRRLAALGPTGRDQGRSRSTAGWSGLVPVAGQCCERRARCGSCSAM